MRNERYPPTCTLTTICTKGCGFLLRSICHLKPLCHRAPHWSPAARGREGVIYVSKSLCSGGRWSNALPITHIYQELNQRISHQMLHVFGDDSARILFFLLYLPSSRMQIGSNFQAAFRKQVTRSRTANYISKLLKNLL